MRRLYFYSTLIIMLAAGCCLSSCKKDEESGGKRLQVIAGIFTQESSQKMYLEGKTPRWNANDSIRIIEGTTEQLRTIHFNESMTEVTVDGTQDNFYAVFPYNNSTVSSTGGSVTVSPAQDYRTDSYGNQILYAPMAACLHGTGQMQFRNLASVIKLDVSNYNTDHYTLVVYSVSATSTTSNISGTLTFDFPSGSTNTQDLTNVSLSTTDAGKTVTLYCGMEGVAVGPGETKSFYLVVAPYTTADKLTFNVCGSSDACYANYSLVQNTGKTLARNRIGTQPFASNFDNGEPCGIFTVAANGNQVEIAPGNLQYQASTNTWRFAPQQYQKIGWAAGNNTEMFADGNNYPLADGDRSTQSAWIDLFRWGATGCRTGAEPYTVSENPVPSSAISNTTKTISGTDYDWGHYCEILNPRSGHTFAKGAWRLPRGRRPGEGDYSGEFYFMLNERKTRAISNTAGLGTGHEHACFAFATVAGNSGVIIFPDNYVHPAGVSIPQKIDVVNPTERTSFTAVQWKRMELSGCAFLPACGYAATKYLNRDYGYYYTAECANTTPAPYELQFQYSFSYNASGSAASQKSVRLFRDVK